MATVTIRFEDGTSDTITGDVDYIDAHLFSMPLSKLDSIKDFDIS